MFGHVVDHLLCRKAHFLSCGADLFFVMTKSEQSVFRNFTRRRAAKNSVPSWMEIDPPPFLVSLAQSLLFLTKRSELWQNLRTKRSSTNCQPNPRPHSWATFCDVKRISAVAGRAFLAPTKNDQPVSPCFARQMTAKNSVASRKEMDPEPFPYPRCSHPYL